MKQPILLILVLCMIVQIGWTQNNATTIAYIAQFKSIAMKEMKRTGVPASITLAQAILESNSGESNLAKNHNNHFGIKCKSDWTGAKTYQDDDAKQECFRAYDAAEVSFKDHSNFLKNRPNYVDLFLLDPVDDTAWAYGLKKAGYATAADYPKKLLKIIDDYELAQYNFPELENEIEKLTVNLKGKKQIGEDDIEQYVGISKEFNVFELQAALGNRDLPNTLKILNYFAANPKAGPIQLILPTLYSFSFWRIVYNVLRFAVKRLTGIRRKRIGIHTQNHVTIKRNYRN